MSTNLENLVNQAKETVAVKRELKKVDVKIKVNGVSSRRNIKKVAEDNGIDMSDVYVRINFSIEGKDANVTYTASQRLSSLGNLYYELEKEALKDDKDKKVYDATLGMYIDDENNNAFIDFLPDVSEEEFKNALKPKSTKEKGNISGLFSK